ncbi:DUF4333 domain-containing protein [Geodermatophilus marinus]|uniref:DUF4333 domain-containing protein n=1 Tax=Geodermatophilus sp. LHW52908 TaxID=2303986 RepID=UPI000E3D88C1|nr:DUF4333 domain-containing protein [Geodermatophilus sp. LHW52908]RFU20358.1 DUF4333 domain-containing protein [Geodermatophilus sp. LHW52908]
MTQQINTPHGGGPAAYPPPPPAGFGGPPAGFGGPPAGFGGPPPFGAPPAGWGQPPAAPKKKRTGAIVGGIVSALVAIGGLVVGAIFLFGATTIDTAEAERQIAALTEDRVGLAASDVTCPEDVEARAGNTFTCTATLDGQETSFTVEQTDDEGNVEFTSDHSYTLVADVEGFLADEIGAQAGVEAVATCEADGRTVLVGATQAPLDCTVTNATDATDSVDVAAEVDETGTVSYEVL